MRDPDGWPIGPGSRPRRRRGLYSSSFSRPMRRRRRVSSLPRMRQISTAPPGVTALPAAAMRTGHMTLAFFTPSSSASPVMQERRCSSSQASRASRRGIARRSISRELASSDLDFLWTNSSVP